MMKEKIRYGKVTQAEEFLFPDSELGVLPDKLRLAAAKNGRRGTQRCFHLGGKGRMHF
ncbi:MAG: hypothetical protein ACLVLH_11380 [Eisenbergiella massiliensis]